jgi:hypothetical protein
MHPGTHYTPKSVLATLTLRSGTFRGPQQLTLKGDDPLQPPRSLRSPEVSSLTRVSYSLLCGVGLEPGEQVSAGDGGQIIAGVELAVD